MFVVCELINVNDQLCLVCANWSTRMANYVCCVRIDQSEWPTIFVVCELINANDQLCYVGCELISANEQLCLVSAS